jgi:hypothetical protein
VRNVPVSGDLSLIDLSFRSVADVRLAWDAIHDVPDRLAGSVHTVFIWPELLTDANQAEHRALATDFMVEAIDRSDALGSPHTVSMILHRFGGSPDIETRSLVRDSDPPEQLADLARSVQLHSLMAEGGAVIAPANHHFRLPSGNHARSFIRLANMIRSPGDLWSTASWLAPRLGPGVGIVIDTTTLAPVAAQLESLADRAGVELGPTVVLDRYPRSRLEVSRAVESAGDRGAAMAVLSVDSSGVTRSHFEEAMQNYIPGRWTIDVIVEARADSKLVPSGSDPQRLVWTEVDSAPLSEDATVCAHCRDADIAHVVRIDERTFMPLAEPSPAIYMPSTDQSVNSSFWELADRSGAIELEALPADDNLARAERTPLGVKIDFGKLTADLDAIATSIGNRIAEVGSSGAWKSTEQARFDEYVGMVLERCRVSTVVLCPAADAPCDDAVRATLEVLGVGAKRVHYDADALQSDPDRSGDDVVLCYSLGSVTGSSLKRLRVRATDAYAGLEPVINGFCLHARPPSDVEWAAIRNSFKPYAVAALWHSYLPWSSPLRDELELLDRSGVGGPAISNRMRYLADTAREMVGGEYAETALWGANENYGGQAHLRERSLYGYELRANAAFAAVGAAIHANRLRHGRRETAQRFMVDLPKVSRSYFDAVLMASVIRWTKPGEAWWGADRSEEAETMRTMLRFGGSTSEELTVIYPELLIGAALGKVPVAAIEELKASLRETRHRYPPGAADAGPFRAARFAMVDELLHLLEWARPPR